MGSYQMPNGRYEYDTAEEAEFTAEFAFATAVRLSYWAVRVGRAKLRLARHPIMPTETGRRDIMLKLPASATRADAMVGMGLRLGLDPPTSIAHNIPRLRSLAGNPDPTSMKNAVYIGNGSAKYKLPAGPLAPAFRPGPDGDAATCVLLWAEKLQKDPVLQNAVEVIAPWVENLICDCPLGTPCHREAVAYAVMEYRRSAVASCLPAHRKAPKPRGRREVVLKPRRKSPGRLRLALMVGAVAASSALEANISLGWSQVATDRTVRKLFPSEWLSGFKTPCFEDIINKPALSAWRHWSVENNVDAHQNLPDIHRTGWMSAALGAQRGGLHSKHQVEPLVGFGMGGQAHFGACLQVASERRDPWAQTAPAPADLKFAAEQLVRHRGSTQEHHQEVQGALK